MANLGANPLTGGSMDLTPQNRRAGTFKDMGITTAMFTLGQYAMQVIRYFWTEYVNAEQFFWEQEADPVFVAAACSFIAYLIVNKRREVVVRKMNGG